MLRFVRCERHSTLTPFEDGPLNPVPPASRLCPLCLGERDSNPNVGTGTHAHERVVRTAVDDEFPMTPGVARKLEELRAKQPPQWQIDEALADMDYARHDVIARDHQPRHLRGTKTARRIRAKSWGG